MRIDRQAADVFFKHLIRIVSAFSVVALAAIIFFVFIQGVEPFLYPTHTNIRLVAERIDRLEVDGTVYENHTRFIDLAPEAAATRIKFVYKGTPLDFELRFDYSEKIPERMVRIVGLDEGERKYPEAYVHSIIFPGMIAGLDQKLHILIPEPAYGIGAFLGGMDWRPTHNKVYGILPMIVASVLTTLGAVLLGVPIAILSAIFLAEFLPPRIAVVVRSAVELLAGIPSVVYGFFGLMIVVPFLKQTFKASSGSSLLAAVLILAVMILPTIVAISETSLRAVPQSYREAALALGATKMQTAWTVVVPPARSGIITGIILGTSRALGETMAVILVAGNSPQIPSSPLDGVRTLTSTIALEMGYAQGRHNQILFSVGIVLFIMIFSLNTGIMLIKRRMPEVN